jgi:hypothetical protein
MTARLLSMLTCVICLTGALSSVAADEVEPRVVSQSKLFYQPNRMGAGVKVVHSGDDVVVRPTAWALSAKLDVDAILSTSEGQVRIPAGAILPSVTFSGISGSAEVSGFCTAERKSVADKSTGSIWASLQTKLIRSLEDGRKCIVDTDGDGQADVGFLLNDGSKEDRIPKSIRSVNLNVAKLRERNEGSSITIKLVRVSRPTFAIYIYDEGKQKQFSNLQSTGVFEESWQEAPKGAQFPVDMVVFGAKLKLIASDKKAKTVTIEMIENDEYREVPTFWVEAIWPY